MPRMNRPKLNLATKCRQYYGPSSSNKAETATDLRSFRTRQHGGLLLVYNVRLIRRQGPFIIRILGRFWSSEIPSPPILTKISASKHEQMKKSSRLFFKNSQTCCFLPPGKQLSAQTVFMNDPLIDKSQVKKKSPFTIFKKKNNLAIGRLSLGVYAPGPQVLTYRPQILREVRIWTPFRVPGPEQR